MKEIIKKIMEEIKGNKILNPNCSETIWRLNIEKSVKEKIIEELDDNPPPEDDGITLSDKSPNSCLREMIDILMEAKKNGRNIDNTELEFLETQGTDLSIYSRRMF